MSYGFKFTGTDGSFLISEGYRSFHFVGDATHQGSNLWRINTGYSYRVQPFFVATYFTGIDRVWESSTGVWDIQIKAQANNIPSRVLCFALLDYHSPTSNYGLRVMGAAGRVCFDSSLKPLYIRQIVDYTSPGPLSGIGAEYATGLTTPAVSMSTVGAARAYIYGNIQDYEAIYLSAAKTSGGSVHVGNFEAWKRIISHEPVVDLPAPDVYEDVMPSTAVPIIDAAMY